MKRVQSVNTSTFRYVYLVGALLFIACVCYVTLGLRYHLFYVNASHSLPHAVYVTKPLTAPVKRGDYVMFTHPHFKEPIIKQILGVEGDVIVHNEGKIQINGTRLALSATRSNGMPLNPIKVSVVPKSKVFVAGTHRHSFDSRYEEFGLIALDAVRGCVCPLF